MVHAVTVRADDYAVSKICHLDWQGRSEEEMVAVAWAYYYSYVQFRENLEICCDHYPDNQALLRLKTEECKTSDLSPFPGVAMDGEKMNHDEFMRRLLELSAIELAERERFELIGGDHLAEIRNIPQKSRATSIESYQDGGLEWVFTAKLRAPAYSNPSLSAFRFFLSADVEFDSDQNEGHGSLSRHLLPMKTLCAFGMLSPLSRSRP